VTDPRRRSPIVDPEVLDRAEGRDVVDAATVVVKAALECEIDCAGILVGTDGPLRKLIGIKEDPEVAAILQRHRMVVLARATPERRLVEAGRLADRGAAIAVVAPREVPRVCAAMDRGGDARRRGTVVIAIDDPIGCPGVPVRRHFADLDIPVIEPGDLEELRSGIEHAAMFADAIDGPVALVVDEYILRTSTTLSLRPNRVVETRDAAAALRRRRVGRGLVDTEVVQITRRLGLDQTVAMPSPGEREVLGIVATGITSMSVRHLLEELRLTGRVPTVFPGVVHPIDPASIERLLRRCRLVLVLENRPGLLAPLVLEMAERIRATGETVAEVAWRDLPTSPPSRFEPGDGAQPSVIARRLLPLLQEIRPGLTIDQRLGASNAGEQIEMPPRPVRGGRGGVGVIRRAVVAADRVLRGGADDLEPVALSINGRSQAGFKGKVVGVEIVARSRLLEEAVPLVSRRDARSPWVVAIADREADGLDAGRVLDAAIPTGGESTPKVGCSRPRRRGRSAMRWSRRCATTVRRSWWSVSARRLGTTMRNSTASATRRWSGSARRSRRSAGSAAGRTRPSTRRSHPCRTSAARCGPRRSAVVFRGAGSRGSEPWSRSPRSFDNERLSLRRR